MTKSIPGTFCLGAVFGTGPFGRCLMRFRRCCRTLNDRQLRSINLRAGRPEPLEP